MNRLFFTGLIALFTCNSSIAQDFHLAQFDANPLNLNPALTGERLTDLKGFQLNCNYREQIANYSSSSGSFKNISAGLDIPINSKFSIGQYFGNNKTGDGVFNASNFMISTAYKINNADISGTSNFSVGLQLGLLNTTFNPQNFTYGNQYSASAADGFDRTIVSGENLFKVNLLKFNVNLGLYYRKNLMENKLVVFGGASLYNISTPAKYDFVQAPIPLKYNVHAGAIYKVDEKLSVQPQILFMNQLKANELNMTALFFYKLTAQYEAIFGAGFRNKNALIVNAGLRVNSYTFRMSYCAVSGTLYDYRNKGLEFSLIYTAAKKVKTPHEVL